MHSLIGLVASAIHNKDLTSLDTLLKMFLYQVELLHKFVYEEWIDRESLTTKLKITIQQTNNSTRYGGMSKKEIMFFLSSIKSINIKKTLKSFNAKLTMVNLRCILRYIVHNDNNGIPPEKKKRVVSNDTMQIFYLPQAEENEAIPLFKRRSLHLSAIANLKDNIEMIDIKYEEAARTLGANKFIVFISITLPLSLPGIIAGFTLCFARALGEFGATVTFVSNIPGETQTLSTAIYNFLQIPNGELMAMRLTLISIFISIAALILSEIIFDKFIKYKREHNE